MPTYNLTNGDDLFEPFDSNNPWGASPGEDNLINALDGDDVVVSGSVNDTVNGGNGNDLIFGSNGDDSLNGDAGNDILDANSGDDTLSGGAGTDTYVIQFSDNGDQLINDDDGIISVGFVPIGSTELNGFTLSGTASPTGNANEYTLTREGVTLRLRMDGNDLIITQPGEDEDDYSLRIADYTNGTFGIILGSLGNENNPPTANNDNASTDENTAIAINVLSNDSDSDGTLDTTSVAAGNASNGTVNVDGTTGEITYTPNNGFTGNDSFTYTVDDDDGATSNTATVTVTVEGDDTVSGGAEGDPIANADERATTAGQAVTIAVLDNDSDDGTLDATSVNVVNGPQNGGVNVDSTTGEITYTPNDNFSGEDTFNYTVQDDEGNSSNVATVKVDVTGGPERDESPDGAGSGQDGDTETGTAGDDLLGGDADNNTLLGGAGIDLIYGAAGDDSLDGGDDTDLIGGSDGEDTILGGGGDDLISSGNDADSVDGGTGNDEIFTDTGNDTVSGGAGNDTVYSWSGTDEVSAGEGDDLVTGDGGNDTITGDGGIDSLWGGTGDDTISGGDDNDFLGGDDGNDNLAGDAGNDTIFGWSGNDTLTGGTGDDQLSGEDGDDDLEGGNGNDSLYGGAGADSYIFSANNFGNDIIYDEDGTIQIGNVTIVGTMESTGNGLYELAIGGETYEAEWSGNLNDSNAAATLTLRLKGDTNNSVTITDFVNGTFGITLAEGNAAPVATDDSATLDEDTNIVIDVLNNDSDSDGTLDATTVAIGTGPTNGQVSVDPATGEITYTPDADYNGTDSFTYTVQDDEGTTSNEATVNLTINDVAKNVAPVAVNDRGVNTEEGQAVTLDVLANDSDSDGTIDASSVTIVDGPDNGQVSVDGTTGEVTYTPDASYTGTETFTYTVEDDDGATSNEATVTVKVNAPNPGSVIEVDSLLDSRGTSGNDTMEGVNALNAIEGAGGNDSLIGNTGGDILNGGLGDDTLQGNAGNDLLYGGDGDNAFVFASGDGHDEVADFNPGGDIVVLDGFAGGSFAATVSPNLTQDGDDALLTLDANTSIRFNDVNKDSFDASDFMFQN